MDFEDEEVDGARGPFAGETELAPGGGRLLFRTEEAGDLRKREMGQGIILVDEDDQGEVLVADVQRAGDDIDAEGTAVVDVGEGFAFNRPDLTAQDRDVACAGVEGTDGGGGA